MKQHTPGEWVVGETYLDGCFSTVITKVSAPEKRTTICDIWGMDTEEGKANAKLIAAAPDLLKALNYAIRFIRLCPLINEDQYPKGLENWELLIKKATE